ncbi:MAG: hypothetical protein PVJ07_00870 [Anaerolineales bacterium]
MDDPIEGLLALAERSYVRMEAKELIAQCLEQGDLSLFDQLLQSLVLAGASSLLLLRDILEEIRTAKSALSSQGMGVRQDLIDAFADFGLRAPQLLSADAPELFRMICSQGLHREVRQAAAFLDREDEMLLEEICQAAGERVTTIARKLILLKRIEESVEDWFLGLAHEAVREQKSASGSADASKRH